MGAYDLVIGDLPISISHAFYLPLYTKVSSYWDCFVRVNFIG
jgi:hypothetical protein